MKARYRVSVRNVYSKSEHSGVFSGETEDDATPRILELRRLLEREPILRAQLRRCKQVKLDIPESLRLELEHVIRRRIESHRAAMRRHDTEEAEFSDRLDEVRDGSVYSCDECDRECPSSDIESTSMGLPDCPTVDGPSLCPVCRETISEQDYDRILRELGRRMKMRKVEVV